MKNLISYILVLIGFVFLLVGGLFVYYHVWGQPYTPWMFLLKVPWWNHLMYIGGFIFAWVGLYLIKN